MSGDKVGRFPGALDGEGERRIRGSTFDFPQSLDGIFAACARADAVHCFRRKSDQPALSQRLDGPMNYVTSIFGVSGIEHNGRHWQADLAFPQGDDNPPTSDGLTPPI